MYRVALAGDVRTGGLDTAASPRDICTVWEAACHVTRGKGRFEFQSQSRDESARRPTPRTPPEPRFFENVAWALIVVDEAAVEFSPFAGTYYQMNFLHVKFLRSDKVHGIV
jgi:hypothetical protein